MVSTINLKEEIKKLEEEMMEELKTYSFKMKLIRSKLDALREKCDHEDKNVFADGTTECNTCGKVL